MAKNFEIVNVIKKKTPYCTLYLGQLKPSNEAVAVKSIDLDHGDLVTSDELVSAFNEITRLKQLRHDNVQQIYYCSIMDTRLLTIHPIMAYGSCKDIIEQTAANDGSPGTSVFNEQSLQIISKSVLQAIEYIHSKHIIHRCVCPEHIFISANGHVVLGGFKFSVSLIDQGNLVRKLHDYPSSIKNYLNYLSPELLQQNLIGYNTKADIYSFGVTLCELANGVNPFVGCEKTQMLLEKLVGPDIGLWDRTILNDESKTRTIEVISSENPQVIESIQNRLFTDVFRNFVDLCVTKNYEVRLNASQLLQHPYVRKAPRRSLTDFLDPIPCLTVKGGGGKTTKTTTLDELFENENIKNSFKNHELWNFE